MIKINAVYSEKIWGGNKINDLGFDSDPNKKIGEAWIISAYPENSSLTDEGVKLDVLYKNNKALFNNYKTDEFPLLAKIIDANDDLSIQVHPNNEKALELENYPFGKTECWYIIDSEKDTDIVIGTNASNIEEANTYINNNDWESFIKKQNINAGDIFDIRAGTVHAILRGTLVYELQQSSDITYRLYDFDRRDDEGNLRELHIEKSLKVIDYEAKSTNSNPLPLAINDDLSVFSLVKNDIFDLEKWIVKSKVKLSLPKEEKNFLLLTVIEGSVIINGKELNAYESGIITADELEDINLEGNATILVGNPN